MSEAEKILNRVRGLLAQAANTPYQDEADTFRAAADRLMTEHAIEQYQLDRANAKASSTAVRKNLDIAWYFETKDSELRALLWQLCNSVMHHSRVEVVIAKMEARKDLIPVVGMPSDIDYADMLFTHLMQQVIDTMDPKPKPGESLVEALARMKESGMKWEHIYNRLVQSGLQEDWGPWTKSVASRCNYAGKYTKFCESTSRKRLRVSPAMHRRSFIYGFNTSMSERLRAMREDQGQYSGSMALALRDYREQVKEAVYIHFPDLKPHDEDCQCERCRSMRESASKPIKKGRVPKMKIVRIDMNSVDEGSQAAERVQIIQRGDPNAQRISGNLGSSIKKEELDA